MRPSSVVLGLLLWVGAAHPTSAQRPPVSGDGEAVERSGPNAASAIKATHAAAGELGADAPLGEASSRASSVFVSKAQLGPNALPGPTLALRARAQRRILTWGGLIEDESGRVVRRDEHANGNALGRYVPVENEAALAQFHTALRHLRDHPSSNSKVRIAAYGASHTQGDFYTGYLRYYLQSRFGNGGLGFMPLGVRRTWSRRFGFKLSTRNLNVEWAQARDAPSHGLFGLSGSAATAAERAFAKIRPSNITESELRASQYELFYLAEPGGADLSIRVNGETPLQLPGSAPQPEARYYRFMRRPGWHTVRLRSVGEGTSRWFGLSIERDSAGVVVDTLGIRGTRAANMLRWDEELWFEHLRRRNPALVMLAYGTNETVDEDEPIEEYDAQLSQVLQRIRRAVPAASCLLVGPGDFPRNMNGTWVPRPRLEQIIAHQRRVAIQQGCGFWDSYAFMGGQGSMDRWVKATPRLGARDHIHFTVRGYVRMGMALGDAMLRALDAGEATASVEPPSVPAP